LYLQIACAKESHSKSILQNDDPTTMNIARLRLVFLACVVSLGVVYYLTAETAENAQKCPTASTNGSYEDPLGPVHYAISYEASVHLQELGLSGSEHSSTITTHVDFPVRVTAATANHFDELQGLLKGVHTHFNPVAHNNENVSVIVYDIGLFDSQRDLLRQYCKNCEVRVFPFDNYPQHVRDVHGYSWKPIIIQLVLQQYDFVMWVDTSIRFKTENLTQLLRNARKHGLQVLSGDGSIAERTDRRMFEYFGEDPCLFMHYSEIQAGWSVWLKNNFTQNAIFKPWLTCALTDTCMVLVGANFHCYGNSHHVPGYCHRYDQSALGIILMKLYGDSIHDIIFPEGMYGIANKFDPVKYFPEQTFGVFSRIIMFLLRHIIMAFCLAMAVVCIAKII
jgi:hypothetical protein